MMNRLFRCGFNRYVLMLGLVSAGAIAGAASAQAAPQLRYRTVSLDGTAPTCLDRARAAMTRAGFANPATTDREVMADNGQLTAAIVCQPLTAQQLQATVMVAATETVAPATVTTALETLGAGLTGSGGDAGGATSPSGRAMDDDAFNQLMVALEDSWPDYLEFLAQPVSQNYFTAAQASRIVDTMRFPDEQVEAAVLLYPRVVDPGNWFRVEQTIELDSARQELRERLSAP